MPSHQVIGLLLEGVLGSSIVLTNSRLIGCWLIHPSKDQFQRNLDCHILMKEKDSWSIAVFLRGDHPWWSRECKVSRLDKEIGHHSSCFVKVLVGQESGSPFDEVPKSCVTITMVKEKNRCWPPCYLAISIWPCHSYGRRIRWSCSCTFYFIHCWTRRNRQIAISARGRRP